MTTNEAAERLSRFLGLERQEELADLALHNLLDEALAAERRATVERIRERLTGYYPDTELFVKDIVAILDEEADR
jgi:hypothetical protein